MLKIALAQLNVHAGDPRRNVQSMERCISQAKEQHCHVIVFPELSIPGYLIGDLWDQPDYIRECVRLGDGSGLCPIRLPSVWQRRLRRKPYQSRWASAQI